MRTKERYILLVGALFGLMGFIFVVASPFNGVGALVSHVAAWTAPLYVLGLIALAVYLSMKNWVVLVALILLGLVIASGFVGPSSYAEFLSTGFWPDGSTLLVNPILITALLLFISMIIATARIYKALPVGSRYASAKPAFVVLTCVAMLYALVCTVAGSIVLIGMVRTDWL